MWWEDWAAICTLRGRLARRRAALAHHLEGPHLRADRRHRGRRHHLSARDPRGRAQLGLPLLLAARRHAHPGVAHAGRLPRRSLAWRDWLLRAVAGDVSQLQIMYGPAGERRLDEWELDWLPGYEESSPVRMGNAASGQFQLDVYGEVISALYESCIGGQPAQRLGLGPAERAGRVRGDAAGSEPDDGIWEVRGPRRHFTHSKVMAWVAVDRAVRTVEQFGARRPRRRWRELRDRIHDEVCDKGYNADAGAFTQYYGSDAPRRQPPHDPARGVPARHRRPGALHDRGHRARAHRGRLRAALPHRGRRRRGRAPRSGGGLPGLLVLDGRLPAHDRPVRRRAGAVRASRRRCATTSGCSPRSTTRVARRQVGNFPQAFSHVSLVNTAFNLLRPPCHGGARRLDPERRPSGAGLRRGRAGAVHGLLPARRYPSSQSPRHHDRRDADTAGRQHHERPKGGGAR